MKSYVKSIMLILIVTALFACTATETRMENNPVKTPEVAYSEFALENGMKIFVVEDHKVPLMKFEIWYNVGSIDEPERISGISHMLEHTMFLGTKSLGKDKVHHLTKQVGGWANAGTFYDFTMYEEELPSAKLELAMAIESDRMQNLKIDPEEFAREQQVVAQERRMRTENSFFMSSWEEMQSVAFEKHPLHHTVIGWMDSILNYSVDDMRAYYSKYYSPNNAVMVVSGDVDPENVHALAVKYFGDYSPKEITRLGIVEPEQTEEKFLKIEKITNVPIIAMMYKSPQGDNPDVPVIEALADILVNNSTSRVKTVLKNEKHMIMETAAIPMSFRDSGFVMVYLVPMSVDGMDDVLGAFDAEIARLIDGSIEEKELAIVKKSALKAQIFMMKNTGGMASQMALDTVRFGNPELYKDKLAAIKNMNAEDIKAIAEKYLSKDKRTVAYIVPKSK